MSSTSAHSRTVHRAKVEITTSGLRIDLFLTRRFGQELDLSRRRIRDLIAEGQVFVNGQCTRRLSRELRVGEWVELRLLTSAPPTEQTRPAQLAGQTNQVDQLWALPLERVLYEDADVIAVDKPAGLPTQATLDRSRHHLYQAVELYLRDKDPHAYAGLHHRLDRETSGVVLFTKSRRANAGLARQFAEHTARKIYLALIAAPQNDAAVVESSWDFATTWEVRNHLRKRTGKPARMEVTLSGGDRAETAFTVQERHANLWLVQAEPKTGRMHQIRVHLNGCGLPILGDPLYGPRSAAEKVPRLMLHASELRVAHPVTGEPLILQAPQPTDFATVLEHATQVEK